MISLKSKKKKKRLYVLNLIEKEENITLSRILTSFCLSESLLVVHKKYVSLQEKFNINISNANLTEFKSDMFSDLKNCDLEDESVIQILLFYYKELISSRQLDHTISELKNENLKLKEILKEKDLAFDKINCKSNSENNSENEIPKSNVIPFVHPNPRN